MVGSASNGVSSARTTLSSQSTDVEVEDEIKEAFLIPSRHGMDSVRLGVLPPTPCHNGLGFCNRTREYPEQASCFLMISFRLRSLQACDVEGYCAVHPGSDQAASESCFKRDLCISIDSTQSSSL